MCDYSLTALRTRLAIEGEELITYRFPTGSVGLTSSAEFATFKKEFSGWRHWVNPREVPCAVCIPPGARLLLRDIPDQIQRQLGIGDSEEVIFIQTSAEAWRHRDGLRFKNGQEILLQRLRENQRADVLSLSLADLSETVAEADALVRAF